MAPRTDGKTERHAETRASSTSFVKMPSKKFWTDFWPAFWATAIGVGLSIPAGLYLDRVIKRHDAAHILPAICQELKESKPSLQTFKGLPRLPRDAVGIFGAPLRSIRMSFAHGGFQAVDKPDLVAAISDAYASLDEVNGYLTLYRSAYAQSSNFEQSYQTQATEALLSNTSDDAMHRVDHAIDVISQTEGTGVCE